MYTTNPDRAGAGKLRIYSAIVGELSAVSEAPRHPALSLRAIPNPFNPTTTIGFDLPTADKAQVRIFDVAGREVWNRVIHPVSGGRQNISGKGRDGKGRSLPSGLYFAHVKQGEVYAACKLTLVK